MQENLISSQLYTAEATESKKKVEEEKKIPDPPLAEAISQLQNSIKREN